MWKIDKRIVEREKRVIKSAYSHEGRAQNKAHTHLTWWKFFLSQHGELSQHKNELYSISFIIRLFHETEAEQKGIERKNRQRQRAGVGG